MTSTPRLDRFAAMNSEWRSAIPAKLRKEDPTLLIELLKLGWDDGGVSQTNLRKHLHINQPRLSKLIQKLEDVGWVTLARSEKDGRVALVTATRDAKNRLESLNKELVATTASKKAVRKHVATGEEEHPTPEQGVPGVFDFNGYY